MIIPLYVDANWDIFSATPILPEGEIVGLVGSNITPSVLRNLQNRAVRVEFRHIDKTLSVSVNHLGIVRVKVKPYKKKMFSCLFKSKNVYYSFDKKKLETLWKLLWIQSESISFIVLFIPRMTNAWGYDVNNLVWQTLQTLTNCNSSNLSTCLCYEPAKLIRLNNFWKQSFSYFRTTNRHKLSS